MTPLYTFRLFSFFTESRFLICFFFLPVLIYAQPVSQTFNSSGTYTIPTGYKANINVRVWGAGGGGGNAVDRSGGGGGGAFSYRIYTDLAAGNYTVTVGTGGTAGVAGMAAAGNGGSSSFTDGVTTTTAAGGSASGGTSGGAGGTTANSSGLYTRAGGNGGAGNNDGGGGGGGGSATTTADGSGGSNGGGSAGGAGGTGEGAGGRGGDEDGTPDAAAGNAPGGGGGGRGDDAGTSKAGANGRVIVTVTFYWEASKTLATIGGGSSAAETGCYKLPSSTISTAEITVPAGSRLSYRIGANAGEPVCSDNDGTAAFEGDEGIGLFASATPGGTQVFDSRLFKGAGTSNTPPNILPTGSGCIYNNNADTRYLTIKTIDTTNNIASLPSQEEEIAFIAYEVISGNSGCINLPIQLTSFDVRLFHKTPLVEWTTMSELNNAYYSLERSTTGSDFKEIATIYGHGTTDGKHDYSYTDYKANKGINYYRLTQVDLDGQHTTYHTVSVFVPVEDIVVFPTIFDQEVNLQMPLPYDKPVTWVLYDSFGKSIRTGVLRSQPVQQLSLPGIGAGTYILTIVSEEELKSHKLIKL